MDTLTLSCPFCGAKPTSYTSKIACLPCNIILTRSAWQLRFNGGDMERVRSLVASTIAVKSTDSAYAAVQQLVDRFNNTKDAVALQKLMRSLCES